MGFLDKAKAVAGAAADKAKDVAGDAKQKLTIAENEKKIKDVYEEIGALLYTQFPELIAEKCPEAIEKIKGFEELIAAAKAALEGAPAEEAKPEE